MSPGKKQEERAALHLLFRKLALGVVDMVRILKMALADSYNTARKAYPSTQVHHDNCITVQSTESLIGCALLAEETPKSI